MNAFVRQLAVLSVLWSLCEMLLPDGKQQAVRMTVSVLVLTSLLGTAGKLISGGAELPAWSVRAEQTGVQTYRRTVLASAANQAENWCVRMAHRAGYEAEAAVWLLETGALERIEMTVKPSEAALVSMEELRRIIAQEWQTDAARVLLSEGS